MLIEILRELRSPEQATWARYWLGYAYMKKGDYDRAIEIFNEFANKTVPHGLFNSLEGLEYVYRNIGKRDEFLNFCKDYREKYAESIKELPLQQWYLEPSPISDEYSNLAFADDLDNEPLDSSWVWLDPFNDCSYKILENKCLEISAVNGRNLAGLNLSAPRFVKEITGDFAIQVCILPPLEDKPQLGGLLIWKDESNYVCFTKGNSDRYGFQFFGYIDKNYLMAGRGYLPDENDDIFLRIERSGDVFSAYVSTDGINWLTCGKLSMKIDDPIQVGIYAHGMINRTVYCGEYREGSATLFREFSLLMKE